MAAECIFREVTDLTQRVALGVQYKYSETDICNVINADSGYGCTRRPGHPGIHVAHGSSQIAFAYWGTPAQIAEHEDRCRQPSLF